MHVETKTADTVDLTNGLIVNVELITVILVITMILGTMEVMITMVEMTWNVRVVQDRSMTAGVMIAAQILTAVWDAWPVEGRAVVIVDTVYFLLV